jgi:3'(2'), 5'-bisphosphate nucleotidase
MAFERELDAAKEAVARASEVCRRVQRNLDAVRAVLKDDKSPVTVADLASQAVVAHQLARLGAVTLVAEEDARLVREAHASGQSALVDALLDAVRSVWRDAEREAVFDAIDRGQGDPHLATDGFWTLDPIDGTKGFLRGEQYAISLARIERGIPVLGVLGCPNLSLDRHRSVDQADPSGSLYFALRGEGLFEASLDGRSQRQITRAALAADAPLVLCESVESGHTKHDASERIMEHLGQASRSIRLDSQAKYAVVARGQADVYLRMPTKRGYVERIWDHAAGALCAVEGGCVVSDVRGVPLDFSRGRGLEANLGVVVAPPGVHGRIISAIGRLKLDAPPAA